MFSAIFISMIDISKLTNKQIDLLSEQISPKPRSYNKGVTVINPSQPSDIKLAQNLAKTIYNSKSLLADNEQLAVNAIKRIPNNKVFELVQTELRKLTGGLGVGQYIKSFIQDGAYQAQYTLTYINGILKHLKQIKANPKTIEIFTNLQAVYKARVETETSEDVAIGGPELRQYWKDHHHEIMLAASLGALFFGPIGLLVSAGISLGDATMYYQEGDRYTAGIMAGFALLPGLGKIAQVSKPISQLGANGMAALGKKLATSSSPVLNRVEMYAINDMAKYSNLIKTEMNSYFKARAKNEAAYILRKNTAPGAKKIIQRLGDGSLKATTMGTKFGINLAPGFAGFELYNQAWDKAYVKLGFDQKDLQDINKISLQTLKNVKEGTEMNSKYVLENIIRETILEQVSPFKNQEDGDKFREWLNLNKPGSARNLNLDKTGPYNNATIIKAYKLYGKEYKDVHASTWDMEGLSDGQWLFLIIVGLGVGIAGYNIIKTFSRKMKFLYENFKALIPQIKKTKITDIESFLIKNPDIDSATKEKLLAALKNPRVRVEMQGELNRLLIDAFKRDAGVSGDDLIKILSPEEQALYGPDIKRIQAARNSELKSHMSSKTAAAIKVTVSRDAKWTTANSYNLTLDNYVNQVAKYETGIYDVNQIAGYKSKLPAGNVIKSDFEKIQSQFKTAKGSKDGVWILNTHMDASKFPSLGKWVTDLMLVNPKLTKSVLTPDRYRRAKAKWYMTKHFS